MSEERLKHMLAYEQKAQALAERVTAQWQHAHAEDARGLADAVHCALVDEANLELRQILAQLSGQLELAQARADRGSPSLPADKIRALLSSLDRASTLMDVYLDRSAAAKFTIRIEAAEFDLAAALGEHLAAQGLTPHVDAALLDAPVIADRAKLLDALGHLIGRFYLVARPRERVMVQVAQVEDRIEGFIGLSPSHLGAEQLMEEMRLPLAIEDVGIDVSYARAVLERHGGVLFVANAGDHATGFGFHLPLLGGAT